MFVILAGLCLIGLRLLCVPLPLKALKVPFEGGAFRLAAGLLTR